MQVGCLYVNRSGSWLLRWFIEYTRRYDVRFCQGIRLALFITDPLLPAPTVPIRVDEAFITSAATLVFLHGESSPVSQTIFLIAIIWLRTSTKNVFTAQFIVGPNIDFFFNVKKFIIRYKARIHLSVS